MIGSCRPPQKGTRMPNFDSIRYEAKNGLARSPSPGRRKAMRCPLTCSASWVTRPDWPAAIPLSAGVLVAGEGSSFCAGIDLGLLPQLAPLAAGASGHPDDLRSFVRLAQRPFLPLARMPKPTLAAVQGDALGAGFQLALACDLRVAATDVRLGMLDAPLRSSSGHASLTPPWPRWSRRSDRIGPPRHCVTWWHRKARQAMQAR
jgi:1,4-dihydroxy-2-naphthoyl-CoA synthase